MSIIEVKNVSFAYSHGTPFQKTAVENISFSVEKGELIGVIGHTGSGKSTLMQMLNALLKPESGEVFLEGKNINTDKQSIKEARFKVGLCFQYPEYQLFEETCAKDIAFGPRNMGLSASEIDDRVNSAADFVGLDKSLLQKSPFDLSGGQKRRVAIAGVMAMLPEVLILDEPTAGLDPKGKESVIAMLQNYREKTGATVIIVTHSMEIAAGIATKLLVLNKGRLAYFDTPSEVFKYADELIKMGLDVPAVTRIISVLRANGFNLPENVYTLQDAAQVLADFVKKEAKT